MPLTDFADYKARIADPPQFIPLTIPTLTTIAGRAYDLWTTQVPVGAAPTTAVVPTSATAGALPFVNGGTGALGITGGRFNAANPGVYLICDRLSHQGGLAGNSAAQQTTNLPTAALTRYTSGVGVMCGLTIYTQIGATASTVSVTYTNTADVGSRVSPSVLFGATNYREAGRMILIPNAVGDLGFKSVQSVTSTVNTTTAGNFGVTLFKPLAAVICDEQHAVAVCDLISGRIGGGLPEIPDDACLFVLCISQGTNAQGVGAVLTTEW